jgi:hypothetical protein
VGSVGSVVLRDDSSRAKIIAALDSRLEKYLTIEKEQKNQGKPYAQYDTEDDFADYQDNWLTLLVSAMRTNLCSRTDVRVAFTAPS